MNSFIKKPTFLLAALTFVFSTALSAVAAPTKHECAESSTDWPLWKAYRERFVQADGRIIDFDTDNHYTTSEGQAYTLFFSLIANDRERFSRILKWTEDNLAKGDLGTHLPSWQWGKRDDATWGVVDANPASDADLWLAYTLFEAGRLWNEPRYRGLATRLLTEIKRQEIVELPLGAPMLLPGPQGFTPTKDVWRFNPSYLPPHLLRAFAVADASGPWIKMLENTIEMLSATSSRGFAADWLAWQRGQGWTVDPIKGPTGSYDAIRVYLWVGMLNDADPLKKRLLAASSGMASYLRNNAVPPEKVNVSNGQVEGNAPPGFSAALLPYLHASRQTNAFALQQQRMITKGAGTSVPEPLRYYDQVLSLFGQGWIEKRYKFNKTGHLVPGWKLQCSPIKK